MSVISIFQTKPILCHINRITFVDKQKKMRMIQTQIQIVVVITKYQRTKK